MPRFGGVDAVGAESTVEVAALRLNTTETMEASYFFKVLLEKQKIEKVPVCLLHIFLTLRSLLKHNFVLKKLFLAFATGSFTPHTMLLPQKESEEWNRV